MVGEYLRKLRVVVRLPGRAIFSSGEEFDKRLRELQELIEAELSRGRNAIGTWQDLVDGHA